jgi:hypothetical protein
VVWTGVPAGVYTLYARHPSTRFVTFTATCRPGRVVNANPPWGLHELGKAMPAAVSARWTVGATSLRLRRLRVAKLPPASFVRIRCAGEGCAFRRRTAAGSGARSLDLLRAIGDAGRGFRAGQSLEVLVTARGHDGKLVRWRLRPGRSPRPVTLCVPLGNTRPRSRC